MMCQVMAQIMDRMTDMTETEKRTPTCSRCDCIAHYRDRTSGDLICPLHARLEVVGASSGQEKAPHLTVRPAASSDAPAIGELALAFWGETRVECFGRSYDVCSLAAFVVCDGPDVVGALCFSVEDDLANVVLLNVLPEYQGRGAARDLLEAVQSEASRLGLRRLVVATTNDDLPALAFYQQNGFRLEVLVPGRLVEHHGGEESGFAGIPVRDEIRLALHL
jgi:ribosomal protein S18 acetylase RimI-like enzyme